MAELLVKVSGHWMDDFTQEQISSLSPSELNQFNARIQSGDIVIVRDDGWEWGGRECLPDFIVVRVSDMSVEDAKVFEQSLLDLSDPNNPTILKERQYALSPDFIDSVTGGTSLSKSMGKAQMSVQAVDNSSTDIDTSTLQQNMITKDS